MVLTYDLTFVVDDLIGFSLRSSVKFVSLISMNFMKIGDRYVLNLLMNHSF